MKNDLTVQMVQHFFSENSYLYTKLHGVISQKAIILIFHGCQNFKSLLHYNTYLKVASSKKHSNIFFHFPVLVLKADVPPTLYNAL